MTRANGIAYAVFFLLLALGWRSGCVLPPDETAQVPSVEPNSQAPDYNPAVVEQQVQYGNSVPGSLIVGSFNIQVFGVAKSNDQFVMGHLIDIARRFDLLAIQELRAADQSVMDNFVRMVNADGSRYSFVVGHRQGTTQSKEQYVYLFDTNKLRLTSQPYIAADPTGTMHRPPLVASFECHSGGTGRGFTFTTLNLHIDPDVVDMEFRALEQIMPRVMMTHATEDDFLVLGDFNDSAKRIAKYGWLRNQHPLIRANLSTKPRSGRSIDNIVIDSIRTAEFGNQAGVLNVAQEYGLSIEQSVRVSDHYPVWAVFSTHEQPSRVATASGESVR